MIAAGILIHTVAITQAADLKLESLAADTGGKTFIVDQDDLQLYDKFIQIGDDINAQCK
jgi:hypothetical protein